MSDDMKRLEMVRTFDVPAAELFEAWTDPAVMSRWFFANPTWSVDVEVDLRVGGTYSLRMRAPSGEEFATYGEYREISPPRRLVFTWSSYLVQDTVVTVELTPTGTGTELRLTHDFLDATVRERHHQGWVGCLDSLARWANPA